MISTLHGTITRAGKLTHDRYRRPVVEFDFKPDRGDLIECRYLPEGSVFGALSRLASGQRVRIALTPSGTVYGVWLPNEHPNTRPDSKAQSSPAAAILATL